MEFYTSCCEKRPVRLSRSTREFAYESLHHKYGLDTRRVPAIPMDGIEGFEERSPLEQYNRAIYEIVTKAPLRICEHEKISGAATLGNAIQHLVPVTYQGKNLFSCVSHLTLDFAYVLKFGFNGIRTKTEAALKKYEGTDRIPFLKSCLHCLNCFDLWHERYQKALKDKPGFEAVYQNLLQVPHRPAGNFYEAVQSLWFTFAFVRLCGNWPGFGRLDLLLGDYLKADLAANRITLQEAREILAHFFIKGCEWISGGDYGSGDAQHYQNILLGGVDGQGREITNEVTYLVLDIIEELGISDFPTTVRINSRSPEKLLRRTAEVIRHGGGVVAVYNEDLVLEALTGYGYPPEEAWKFANDGCWEVQIPGKTCFSYVPFDSLALLQHATLRDYSPDTDYDTYEALYCAYKRDLKQQIEQIYENKLRDFADTAVPTKDWGWVPTLPCTVVSLFEEGCIEKGLSYFEGGPVYQVVSPHIGGAPDTANSLYAIKKLVFEEKKVTFRELMEILRKDWEGYEPLRQYVLNRYSYYGNDNEEADEIAAQLLSDFSDLCRELDGRSPIHFPSGVSTFGRQLDWMPYRLSSPHGHKKGEVLAGNMSPTPGTDREGATAIIKSYCKADLRKQVTGAALDIRLLPDSVRGQDGLEALIGLLRGFVKLGGFFMQMDVVDSAVLKDAQAHPENYQTLSVRVSGWNARFVTLNREWQNMIIQEAEGRR